MVGNVLLWEEVCWSTSHLPQPIIIPNVLVPLLLDPRAPLADPPKRLEYRRRLVKVKVGELILDCVRGLLGVVVRDGGVEVVRHVGGPDLVMEEVDKAPGVELRVGEKRQGGRGFSEFAGGYCLWMISAPIRLQPLFRSYVHSHLVVGTVDGVEGAPDVSMVLVFEVGDVDVSVLQPGVEDEPGVYHEVGTPVERHDLRWAENGMRLVL